MALEYQTEAILLTARDWGAADRMVTLFSREYGIVTFMAYGARKAKSQLGGSLQAFTHLHLSVANGRGIDSVKQCDVQTSFREIREDLTRLAYANFIAELTTGLWPERQAEEEVYVSLLAILHLLALRNPRIAALIGAWQLMALAGFQPEYNLCTLCGQKLNLPDGFSYEAGGGLCLHCNAADKVPFSLADRDFLAKLFSVNLNDPGQFAISAKTLINIEQLLHGFVRHQLERPLKSLAFIKQINAL